MEGNFTDFFGANVRAGEGFYNSFTKSINPLIMMGASKEDGDNLIKDLIKVQLEANKAEEDLADDQKDGKN